MTLEGTSVVINEEKFVKSLQYDDFTAITSNLRSNTQEVIDSLKGSTNLSRADKELIRKTLNDFLNGGKPDNLRIRIVHGKKAPGPRLLKRLQEEAGIPIDSVQIRDLD